MRPVLKPSPRSTGIMLSSTFMTNSNQVKVQIHKEGKDKFYATIAGG